MIPRRRLYSFRAGRSRGVGDSMGSRLDFENRNDSEITERDPAELVEEAAPAHPEATAAAVASTL